MYSRFIRINFPPLYKVKLINNKNKGGIISKESFIHKSNVKNIDVKKGEKK